MSILMWRRGPRLRWNVPFDIQRREVIEELRGKGWSLWLRTVAMFSALPLALVILAAWRLHTVGPEEILWIVGLLLVAGTFIHFLLLAGLFYPRRFTLYRGKLVIQSGSGTSVVRLDHVRFCEASPLGPARAGAAELWSLRLFGDSRRLLADVLVATPPGIEEVAAFLRESSVECSVEGQMH